MQVSSRHASVGTVPVKRSVERVASESGASWI